MSPERPQQLLLGIALDEDATFANFHAGNNQQLLAQLMGFATLPPPAMLYLWGPEASGRTHLLQAVCHHAAALSRTSVYLPLSGTANLAPEILENLEFLDLVCVDDLHCMANHREWEQGLFNLLNRVREFRTVIVFSADRPPSRMSMQLPDLVSRLQSSVVYQMQEPGDQDKLALLAMRAGRLGITLDPGVSSYILQRSDRSVPALLEVLQRLARHSLQERKALTIPLVRDLMGW